MERKQRAKKRTSAEIGPATPTTSGKKSRKRFPALCKAAAEAQQVSEEKRVVKQRLTDNDEGERGVDEKVKPSQNKRSSLSKSVAKQQRTEDDKGERGVDEKVEPSQNKRSSLSKSVDKAELVRRAVAHAAAAAEYFPCDDDDDDDDSDDGDKRGKSEIARNLKV